MDPGIKMINRGGKLYRVTTPHFTALFQLTAGDVKVWWAAPALKHIERWEFHKVLSYCQTKEWRLAYEDRTKDFPFATWIEEVMPSDRA